MTDHGAGAGVDASADDGADANHGAPLGVVLAGGESRRFGSPKALASVDGVTLWERAAGMLGALGLPVLVLLRPELLEAATSARATGGDPAPFHLGTDSRSGRGPLGGIETGLIEARERGRSAILVLACDLVRVGPSILEALLASPPPEGGVRAFAAPGPWGVEPLCAVWSTATLPAVEDALDSGRGSPGALLAELPVDRLALPREIATTDREFVFRSANRPEELAELRGPGRSGSGGPPDAPEPPGAPTPGGVPTHGEPNR